MTMAELAATIETGSDTEELLLDTQQPRRASRMRTFTLVAGLVAACALVSLWHNPSAMSKVRHGLFLGLSEDADEDADEDAGRDASCKGLPYVKLESVVSSNIGNKGPDKDKEEGIVYKASAHHLDDLNISDLEIHVHSLEKFDETDGEENHAHDDDYEPAFTHGDYVNGINGRFGIISVKPNKSLKLRFHAYDAGKKKDVPLPHGSISFFDLDGGKMKNGTLHSKEHVTVCEYTDYYLTDSTEITTSDTDKDTDTGDRCTTFTASKSGNGTDNPDDPLALTKLQKDRAVTLAFTDTSEFNVEIGATAGELSRVFSFVFRPSLLCAGTKIEGAVIAAKDEKSPKVVKTHHSAANVMKLPPVVLVLGITSYFI